MLLRLISLFALSYVTLGQYGQSGDNRPPPGTTVCTVTGNKLFIDGYFVRELKGDELEEFNNYMNNLQDFKDKMNAMKERREKEDFHLMKIAHDKFGSRFRREAKLDNSPIGNLGEKPIITNEKQLEEKPTVEAKPDEESDLPNPPELPKFCKTPKPPVIFGGGCMAWNNKVYIRDQPVRDLTDEEVAQVEDYQQKQEEYVQKWRERMQLYGSQAHPFYGRFGMRSNPQMEQHPQRLDQQDNQQQEQRAQEPPQRGDQMFGNIGPMAGNEYGMYETQNGNLDLPKEPEPPKICAVIF